MANDQGYGAPQDAPESLEDVFKRSQDAAAQAGKHNMVHAVLQSLFTGNPSHVFAAQDQNAQMQSKAEQARQFLGTPEFKSIDPTFQKAAASFAGSGDIGHAFEMVNAGRTAAKRAKDAEDAQKLEAAVADFSKSGNMDKYEHELMLQNPTAYATLQGRKRSEERQVQGDVKQAAKEQLNQIQKNPQTAPIRDAQASLSRIQALNLRPEDYNASPEELKAKIKDPKDLKAFLTLRDQMAQKGLSFEASNPIVGAARNILHSLPVIGAQINPAQQAVSPQQYFAEAVPKTMNPQMVQQFQQEQGQVPALQAQIQNAVQTKANSRLYTKGQGNATLLAKQKPSQVDQADWDAASDEEKKALQTHFRK